MDHLIASARPLGRVLAATIVVAGLLSAQSALAQAPAAKQPAKGAQKQAPAPKPAEQPAQPPQQAVEAPPPLMYSPWMKICQNGPETNNKELCVVGTQAVIETGQPVVLLQLLSPTGGERVLRVVLPMPTRVLNGTRILIDQEELAKAPFAVCGAQMGCIADYKADDAVLAKLKKGKSIDVQMFNVYNTIVSLPLPLTDFAKAYDGPATDPKVLEEQQRKLQEALQKKAAEAQKKLEGQQPPAATPPATPPK